MALVGWWPLDGNTEDYTVNQNHGTNSGVTWNNGKIGQCGNFVNGTNTRIIIPNNNVYNHGTKSFSIALWIMVPAQTTNFRGILDKGYSTAYGIFDVTNTAGKVGLYVQSGSNHNGIDFSDSYGQWVHCVWVVDRENNVQRSYKNGVFHVETSFTLNNVTSSNDLNIGTYTSGAIASSYNGNLNDIRIYDHKLSQKEINDLVKAKVLHYGFEGDTLNYFYDGSGYRRNGESNVDLIIENDGTRNAARFTLPYQKVIDTGYGFGKSSSEPMTISMWVKPTIIKNQMFFGTLNGSSQRLYIATYGGKWDIGIAGSAWSTSRSVISAQVDVWAFITLRMSGSRADLFVNGEYSHGINYSPYSYTENFKLGPATTTSSYQYEGYIDNFKIHMTSMSNEDIMEMYNVRAKLDNHGNIYTDEFIEDYPVGNSSLSKIFDDGDILKNIDLSTGTFPYDNTLIAASTSAIALSEYTSISVNAGDVVYLVTEIKNIGQSSYNLRMRGTSSGTTSSNNSTAWTSPYNERIFRSHILTVDSDILGNYRPTLYFSGYTLNQPIAKIYHFRWLNLTSIFGASNEPSIEYIDSLFRDYISSRVKLAGIIKTREFDETDITIESTKILDDKIKIKGNLQEG